MPETMKAPAAIGDPSATPHIEVDHLYPGYQGKRRVAGRWPWLAR